MYWLYFLASLCAMTLAAGATSTVLMLISLFTALGLLLAWTMGWYWSRSGRFQANHQHLLNQVEIQRLREQAALSTQKPIASAHETDHVF